MGDMAAAQRRRMTIKRMLAMFGSSCPRLSRASTSWIMGQVKDVDGRDKPGHDVDRALTTMKIGIGRRRVLGLAAAAVVAPCVARPARAQAYPSRPVKVIVPVAAGGANDTTARLFAQKLSELLGQQFYVENLAGAGGNLGIASAARAPADGYTLLAAGGNFVINPSLYAKIPYDPYADFAPV